MRVLLTGAGGYIGLHLLRALLEAGHQVTALLRSPAQLGPLAASPRLIVVPTDLEQAEGVARALVGQECCVHSALIWGEPGSELELRDVAVAARLFDAAGSAGVGRCILLSSAAVHRPFSAEMAEDAPLHSTDLYGATKAAGELFLRAACASYGMSGVVLRPGPVVGLPAFPGGSFRSDRRLIEWVAAARAGQPIEVAEGEGRQWTDVATVATAVRLLVEEAAPQPSYLCMDREILPWETIARHLIARLQSPSPLHLLPRPTLIPQFHTARIEALLGGRASATAALEAHLDRLVAST
ncbi:MAG TPA: NAD(P)-dependent oxidoreductase [Myxococcota bacterium]|nr:NAD(P)-dependent oxidoreductase [Myxococcota bacterium]